LRLTVLLHAGHPLTSRCQRTRASRDHLPRRLQSDHTRLHSSSLALASTDLRIIQDSSRHPTKTRQATGKRLNAISRSLSHGLSRTRISVRYDNHSTSCAPRRQALLEHRTLAVRQWSWMTLMRRRLRRPVRPQLPHHSRPIGVSAEAGRRGQIFVQMQASSRDIVCHLKKITMSFPTSTSRVMTIDRGSGLLLHQDHLPNPGTGPQNPT